MDNQPNYLQILVDEIHSVVVATTDEMGLPTTRVIDMMMQDEGGVYFLTAKGKTFYKQLKNKPYISLSGMKGTGDTMTKKAISVSGAVRCIGAEKRDAIFKLNPYMDTIYPTKESRTALEVFCFYKGQGEYFDLSTKPITRGSFVFGGTELKAFGYEITNDCIACGLCTEKCPSNCIQVGEPYSIEQQHCLHCGNCFEICPNEAIIKH